MDEPVVIDGTPVTSNVQETAAAPAGGTGDQPNMYRSASEQAASQLQAQTSYPYPQQQFYRPPVQIPNVASASYSHSALQQQQQQQQQQPQNLQPSQNNQSHSVAQRLPMLGSTSSYFSTSATSHFAGSTNEPSSVSSSYKSAVNPYRYSPNTFHVQQSPTAEPPVGNSFGSFHSVNASSFGAHSSSAQFASAPFHTPNEYVPGTQQQAQFGPSSISTNNSAAMVGSLGSSTMGSSSFAPSTSFGTSSVGGPRTSLLTSKLAALPKDQNQGASQAQQHQNQSQASPKHSGSIPATSSANQFPYYTARIPAPQQPPSTRSSAKNSPRGSLLRRSSSSFLPRPTLATTNVTMASAGSTTSAQSKAQEAPPSAADERMDVSPKDEATTDTANHLAADAGHTLAPDASRLLPAHEAIIQEATPSVVSEHLDIATHPVAEVILMLTALLQKIIDANDQFHPQHYSQTAPEEPPHKFTANVLAFHGRNIPNISLHNYLTRILKYCPTTNEVFVSLLVYFDRIAQRANAGEFDANGQQLFVMDSYNIHRLIIAGVTVASKFFSDVFYKNSRYAKVGGLPVEELNHLELQFLLLTDFRLMVSVEELQRYADLLQRFWMKEKTR